MNLPITIEFDPSNPAPFFITILVLSLGFVLLVVAIQEIAESRRQKKILEMLKDKPELIEQLKSRRLVSVEKYNMPKRVKVVVVDKDSELEDVCTISSDRMVRCKRIGMSFIVPVEYKPRITFARGKAYLTYYFTRDGKAVDIKVNDDGVDGNAVAPEPSMVEAVVNRRLLEQIFRSLRMDLTTLLTGVMLGGFIAYVITFVLLPIFGIPVSIGKNVVEVVHVNQPPAVVPPGNYTVGP